MYTCCYMYNIMYIYIYTKVHAKWVSKITKTNHPPTIMEQPVSPSLLSPQNMWFVDMCTKGQYLLHKLPDLLTNHTYAT